MQESVSSSGTPSERPRRITSDLCSERSGASIAIEVARPSDSARARLSKKAGVASGNGFPASGPIRIRSIPRPRHVDRRLGEQDDVAALDVDVLVRRVVARSDATDRPVRGRVHVAHVHLERDERQ